MFFNPILNTLPERGAEFNITMNYALPTGAKFMLNTKRRDKPLRSILSSLRDSPVAKVSPDTNNILQKHCQPKHCPTYFPPRQSVMKPSFLKAPTHAQRHFKAAKRDYMA